jgi:hypothetical protein
MFGALVGFVEALFFGCHAVVPRSGQSEGECSQKRVAQALLPVRFSQLTVTPKNSMNETEPCNKGFQD